jgi:uncharacterized NAD-dependent epimerase/dehydratase family protein
MLGPHERLALYMEGAIADRTGKMGLSVLRYRPNPVVCAVDREHAGADLGAVGGVGRACPIVATLQEAIELGAQVLVLGAAPPGGQVPESWRPVLAQAVQAGLSLVNGLHEPLAPQFPGLRPGQWVWDVRQPPEGLRTGTGAARELPGRRVLFVGTDMSVGKMTAGLEVARAARARGLACGFVATGQVGIVCTGSGIPLDAVRLDYAAGLVEQALLARDEPLVLVEGQGSLNHPASTATLALMRGSMPTHLVLCHRAGMDSLPRFPWVRVPPLSATIQLAEDLASGGGCFPRPATVAVALVTAHLDEAGALVALDAASKESGLPAFDPVRHGADGLLDALLA